MVTAQEGAPAARRHVEEVAARHRGQEQWAEILFRDGRNRAVLISAPPGTPSDPHLHPDFNEWWIVMAGEISWQIGEYEPALARVGDIIIAPGGFRHDIQPRGDVQTMRFGITSYDSNHDLKGVAPSRLIPRPQVGPPNLTHTSLEWMIERHGSDSNWAEEVVLDQRNRANMIHSLPGQASRAHWHPNMDEWWAVLKGELEWRVGGREPFRARKGDVVFVETGFAHQITNVGDEPSVRLAVTTPDVVHHFVDDPDAPPPPRS